MLQGMTSREGADAESSAQKREQVLGQSGGEGLPFLGDKSSFLGEHRLEQTSSQDAGAFAFRAAFLCAPRCHHWRLGGGGGGGGGGCGDLFI